jgi:penicillin-binding protein 1C
VFIQKSLNVPAVRLLKDYGIERFLNKLHSLGLKSIDKSADHYGLPLILGGAESSLWDLTSMYTKLANHLKMPLDENKVDTKSVVLSLTEADIQRNKSQSSGKNTLSPASIYLMMEAMTGLERPGIDVGWKVFANSKKIAWKTGTSYGYKDAWSIGITPDYVVGVWVGNADGTGRPELVGVNASAPLMFSVFENLPSNTKWFDKPIFNMKAIEVCQKSGFIASLNCPETKSIDIPKTQLKLKPCSFHKIVNLNENQNLQVRMDCFQRGQIITKPWFVLPPVMAYYYKKQHPEYKPLPDFHPDCQRSTYNQLELIYPKPEQDIIIPKTLNGETSEVIFKAIYAEEKTLFWHLNDTYIGSTQYFHQMNFQPDAGRHILTIVSESGERLQRQFNLSYTD